MKRLLTITALVLSPLTANAQDLANGEVSFRKCAACHGVGEAAKNMVGPVLNGLDGRKSGTVEGYEDKYYFGRRPCGFYIPRFRNLGKDKRGYVRGFGYQGSASRTGWSRDIAELNIGADLKAALSVPGDWTIGMTGFGEMLPYHDNTISLDPNRKDKWGLPVLAMDVSLRKNELAMRKDMGADAAARELELECALLPLGRDAPRAGAVQRKAGGLRGQGLQHHTVRTAPQLRAHKTELFAEALELGDRSVHVRPLRGVGLATALARRIVISRRQAQARHAQHQRVGPAQFVRHENSALRLRAVDAHGPGALTGQQARVQV